jgi:hypothetical protein
MLPGMNPDIHSSALSDPEWEKFTVWKLVASEVLIAGSYFCYCFVLQKTQKKYETQSQMNINFYIGLRSSQPSIL